MAALLALVGIVQRRTRTSLGELLRSHARVAPLAGAALGATPGCGGAIVVMPLYMRGDVSFGTVVATLVATMGDSSFALIAGAPTTALFVHGVLLVVGVGVGYLVDASGWEPGRRSTTSVVAGVCAPPTPAVSTVGAAAAP
ncbi:MAG: putative manganese transporter, partial [Nitriliruptorales bacterium]|nr:putative manganese transporter [Nitriliruptorales bacterium]